jgi:hypothetical protein
MLGDQGFSAQKCVDSCWVVLHFTCRRLDNMGNSNYVSHYPCQAKHSLEG